MSLKEEIKKILTKNACDMCICNCYDESYPDLGIDVIEMINVTELIMKAINRNSLMESLK